MEVLLRPPSADSDRVRHPDAPTESIGDLSAVDSVGVYGPPGRDGTAIRAVDPLDVAPGLSVGGDGLDIEPRRPLAPATG